MARREPMVAGAKIGQAVFGAFLVMCIYWNAGGWVGQKQIQNTLGAMFFCLTFVTMNNYFGTILIF